MGKERKERVTAVPISSASGHTVGGAQLHCSEPHPLYMS